MTHHGEQHSLSNLVHRSPTPGIQWDPTPAHSEAKHSFNVRSHVNTLYEYGWFIVLITILFTLVGLVYVLVAKPMYEANLIFQLTDENPAISKNAVNIGSPTFETKNSAATEMELLRSRSVVARAVDHLQYYIDVQPKYFPIPLFVEAGRADDNFSSPGIFAYGGYVWANENAEVSTFNVPEQWINREFVLTAQGEQRYRLSQPGQPMVLEGEVGHHYRVQTTAGLLEVRVDALRARAGAAFHLSRHSRQEIIETIQKTLIISEKGSQSGVIEAKLQGHDPRRIAMLLSEVGQEYLKQHRAFQMEESEKSIAFLNRQLPILKKELEESEERYSQFRNKYGTIDVREEVRMSLQQGVAARDRRNELIQKKTELLARFTEDHPVVVALNRQRAAVDVEINEVAARIKTLPALEQDENRLTRDIKVNSELYASLLATSQQTRLSSVSHLHNVRMVDVPTVPENPIAPNRTLIVVIAMTAGIVLGTLAAFVRHALKPGMQDPLEVERLLQARVVYATIPHSVTQDRLTRKAHEDGMTLPLLAQLAPTDPAVESLRSFRVALHFSMPYFKNNVVMFASPTSNLGTSFIAANFAAVAAASGKRVLLIDADLRNGRLHRFFGLPHEPGLSKAIGGSMSVAEVVHHHVVDNLDFISTGSLPPKGADVFLHLNFGTLLETVRSLYDLVLIDPPPILAVSDAIVIGAHAGAVFLVARSGVTTENEIHESLKRLNHAGISPQGVLFNDMAPRLNYAAAYSGMTNGVRLGYSA